MNGAFHSEEEPDLLDRLLGLAPMAQPDPWFATRTMARCLTGKDSDFGVLNWRAFFPRWAFMSVLVLSIGGIGLQQAHRIHTLQTHHQHRVQEAFEVMATMDNDTDTSIQDSSH